MVARHCAQACVGQTSSGTFSHTGQYNWRAMALTSSSEGVGSWAEAGPVENASINPTATSANRLTPLLWATTPPPPTHPPPPPPPPPRRGGGSGWGGGGGGGGGVSCAGPPSRSAFRP